MNNLIIKDVDFQGASLKAVQNEDGKIYVGVSYICRGIGMTQDMKRRQVKNVQDDFILNRGCVKFDTGVFDPNNEALGIELDMLPLWLAKISITPKMIEEKPELTRSLIEYQLKAKDVLAQAFIYQHSYQIEDPVERARKWADEMEEKQKLALENKEQQEIIESKDTIINTILPDNSTCSVGNTGRILKSVGVDTGQKKIFEELRNEEIFMSKGDRYNMPYDAYMKYFEIKLVNTGNGTKRKPYFTGLGLKWYLNKLVKQGKMTCIQRQNAETQLNENSKTENTIW